MEFAQLTVFPLLFLGLVVALEGVLSAIDDHGESTSRAAEDGARTVLSAHFWKR